MQETISQKRVEMNTLFVNWHTVVIVLDKAMFTPIPLPDTGVTYFLESIQCRDPCKMSSVGFCGYLSEIYT